MCSLKNHVYRSQNMINKKEINRKKGLDLLTGDDLTSECATQASEDQARADAQEALEVAQQARRTTQQARETAASAQRTANGAHACCQEQRQRLDRAQERMQQK